MKSPPIVANEKKCLSTLIKLNIIRLMLSSTLAEESGELVKAVLDHEEKNTSRYAIITEAVQTAASAIRFLKNFEEKNNG